MNRHRHLVGLALVLAGAATYAGCGTGDVGSPSLPVAIGPGASPDGGPPDDCIQPACQAVTLGRSAHVVRLSNPQWERTVRDLLRLTYLPGNSSTFERDPTPSPDHFGYEAKDLTVSAELWTQYQTAAKALAALIVDDSIALDALLPGPAKDVSADPTARIKAFVVDFLPRAYRRPVTDSEVDDILRAGGGASALVSTGDPFSVGMTWAMTAVFQNPKFIYRIALGGDAVDANGRSRLTAYEVASKLSYGLWGTMPDEELTALARDGKLATNDGVADVARKMLQDPRAASAITEFHDELYLVNHYPEIKGKRSSDLFPSIYDDFPADAQQDMRLTVQELIVAGNGGLRELQTSDVAFVNRRLAPVYDIDPNGEGNSELANATSDDVFVKVSLASTQRKGLLMHAGWLAYEASPKDPSPIHRGAYVARHVLCTPLGSPPPGAAGANPDKAPGVTNRQRVEATTQGCGSGCHGGKSGVINPLGFSFEGFDAIGKSRTVDNNVPVDTTGEVQLLGKFSGAVQLFESAAKSPYAHACYAAHWSAYLNGISLIDVTPRFLTPAVAKSLKNGSVRDIIVELVQTDAFLTVSR